MLFFFGTLFGFCVGLLVFLAYKKGVREGDTVPKIPQSRQKRQKQLLENIEQYDGTARGQKVIL